MRHPEGEEDASPQPGTFAPHRGSPGSYPQGHRHAVASLRALLRCAADRLPGVPEGRRADAAVVAVILAEIALLTGSFDKYFNHDSIFYVLEAPRNVGELLTLFLQPDSGRQFRPITLAFLAPFVKWWGVNALPYHWIPLLFQVVNTWLLFLLARRLTSSPLASVSAAAFWGLHSVSGWVTYDVTYVSDFLSAFFLFTALILAVDGFRMRSRLREILSVGPFLLALLTKEAATAFPLALLVCLVIAARPGSSNPISWRGVWTSVRRSFPLTAAWLVLSASFAALLVNWVSAGRLYSQDPSSAYHIAVLSNPAAKLTYLWWALNFPARNEAGGMESTVILAGLLALLPWILSLTARRFRLSLGEAGGLIWFAGLCVPALMLSNRVAKWYLYVPLAGLAVGFGCAFEKFVRLPSTRSSRTWSAAAATVAAMAFLFSSGVQNRTHLHHSTDAFVSETLGSFVEELTGLFPTLPPEPQIVFLPSFEDRPSDYAKVLAAPPVSGGRLLQLYYPESNVELQFRERGDQLPKHAPPGRDIRIVQYLQGHLYDVTAYFLGRRLNAATRPVREADSLEAEVSQEEFYPDYESFGTPNRRPVFSLVPTGEIITQIGGSTVSVPVASVPERSRLRFDVSWMHDTGDGAWAELGLRSGGELTILFREYMHPNPPGQGFAWKEVSVDLPEQTAGRPADLVLRCYNDPGRNTVSDWLNWRDIAIESRDGQ